ncbi:TetR family transcriptional regulator [Geotalea uraniireducens]|uniref:TetR family transcriptional regulator n=1 Tax=Geotalea uraniireducens TaxID=351604 RepID=A0ABM8EM08_9BACT|nr:TetR family transcriptional regulator [Geotalea uraniireducens]
MLSVGVKERRQKHKEEFKAEILAAALTLFAREGYANFSMRKLAASIDHSPTAIYLYFRDKDDLLFHICENLYASLNQHYAEIRKQGISPEQTLREIMLCYIRDSLANPELYKVVFFSNPQLYGKPEEFASRDTMALRSWRIVCEVIDDCITDGAFRSADSATLSIVLWSATHGLISSIIFTKDFPMPDPEVMAEIFLDAFFRGLRP